MLSLRLEKIKAFKPRDKQTTKAVTCLEISEKAPEKRVELLLKFLRSCSAPPVGCSPAAPRRAEHPSPCARTAPALQTAPSPLRPGWRGRLSIRGTYASGFSLFFFFQRSAKVSLPRCHLPPIWKG